MERLVERLARRMRRRLVRRQQVQRQGRRIHLRSTEVNEVICLGEITEKLIAQCCISPGIHRVLGQQDLTGDYIVDASGNISMPLAVLTGVVR